VVVSALTTWGIELIRPLLADTSAQARAGTGYARAEFTIGYDTKTVTCPAWQDRGVVDASARSQISGGVVTAPMLGVLRTDCPVLRPQDCWADNPGGHLT
jgi:hypothetical protein